MRSDFIFFIAIISLSCVFASQSTLLIEMNQNTEFKRIVDQFKTESDIAGIIMTMAELESEGKFTPLFDAIKGLQNFLGAQRVQENDSFAKATSQFRQDVTRLTNARDVAKSQWNSDNNSLRNRLYPQKKSLINLVASLKQQLSSLKENLALLITARAGEVTVFKAKSQDYVSAISALSKALPLLNGLKDGQSFAEIDVDIFAQVQSDLKQSLGRLEMGQLYISFVESMMKSLNSQNFVNQDALKRVINMIGSQKDRLQKGLIDLQQDEALNLQRYNSAKAALEGAIQNVTNQIAQNSLRLQKTIRQISKVQSHRKLQINLFNKAVDDLALVNKSYVTRTNSHNELIAELNSESETIVKAVNILSKAGIKA